jgi:hypothetical protein
MVRKEQEISVKGEVCREREGLDDKVQKERNM